MCGFVFAFALAPGRLPEPDKLDGMETAIGHRGPDGRGQARIDRAAMAHRRLSIIDLGGGAQPMSTADRRVWIVFNGEIYNYRALRKELAAAGHSFATRSDTEVLLQAYIAWGKSCVSKLNGMFAFAIYDARNQSVFAARDRYGEKPLYVVEHEQTLYLASELKALVDNGLVARCLDPIALYNYFTNSYVMGPRTIFRNARRLAPGNLLTASDGGVCEEAYWRPPRPAGHLTDESEIIRQSLEILRDSVALRMESDVPVGFFLSGGVDSSAVVALARQVGSQQLDTFSIGFNDRRFDESRYARYVATKLGTRHHEFRLEPGSIDVIDEIAWHTDEPFADAAALPTWFLSKLTRQHVKVALSGDGGDEMFAGYDSYRGHILSERLQKLPACVLTAAAAMLRNAFAAGNRPSAMRLARNIEDAALRAGERFVAKQQVAFRRDFLAGISPYLRRYSTNDRDRELFAPLFDASFTPLAAIAYWQQTVSLVDDMLVKVDRMSMAHGLEVRAPFLDHRIAELMNHVPFRTKVPGGRQKYVLRKAMEEFYPAKFLWRKKQGFEVPLSYWFRDSLRDFMEDRILAHDAIVGQIFRRSALERIVGEHRRLQRDWSVALWTLLMFETWCRRYRIGPESLAE